MKYLYRLAGSALGMLLALSGLGLTGCTKGEGTQESAQSNLPVSFSTTAHIQYKDIQAEAELTRERPKSFRLTFTSPENLNGMEFLMKDESTHVSYRGIGFDIQPDSMPGEAATKLLVSAIDAAAQKEGIRVQLQDGVVTVTGMGEMGEFLLTYDKGAGDILTLEIPSVEFYATFENFNLLE